MKKRLLLLIALFLLLGSHTFAQKISVGIENGINFSNLYKKYDYERFDARPGPVNGFLVKYELGNWLVFQSGVNHITYYYDKTIYTYYDDWWYYTTSPYSSDLRIAAPRATKESTKYSFLRVPLLVKFRTPGRINFEIGGGAYYAFLTNDEYRGKDRDIYADEYIEENFPKMNDLGWILASSVNYNITDRWSVFVSGQVTHGKEKYYENVEGKMGSTELAFGVSYRPFKTYHFTPRSDSSKVNLSVLPHSGVVISRLNANKHQEHYKYSIGFSSGVSLSIPLGQNVALTTGAWYERKGYDLNYTGYDNAIYYPGEDQSDYVQSDVQFDYLTFPVLFDLNFGSKWMHHIQLGPYFSYMMNVFCEGEQTNTYNSGNSYQVTKNYFNESLDRLFKKGDFGAIIAYRLNFPLAKWGKGFISVNEAFGMKNLIINEENDNYLKGKKFRNQSTGIQFGLSIPVTKN